MHKYIEHGVLMSSFFRPVSVLENSTILIITIIIILFSDFPSNPTTWAYLRGVRFEGVQLLEHGCIFQPESKCLDPGP